MAIFGIELIYFSFRFAASTQYSYGFTHEELEYHNKDLGT